MPLPLLFSLFARSVAEQTTTCGLRYTSVATGNVAIEGCIFLNLSTENNGGAICLGNRGIIASVNYSSFDECAATDASSMGGAIYCYSKLLELFSACFSLCSATTANSFYLLGSDDSLSHVSSISASDCFARLSSNANVICASEMTMQFSFLNVSNTMDAKITNYIEFSLVPTIDSHFATLSDLRCRYSLLQSQFSENISFGDANIINCKGNSFCSISSLMNDAFFRSCVFVAENFSSLISQYNDGKHAINYVFENCLFSNNQTNVASCNITLIGCDFTLAGTLSFSDNCIFTNGRYCGIRLPSPSFLPTSPRSPFPSITNASSLGRYQIALIVIGSIAVLCSIGVLIWCYYQKAELQRYKSDARTVLLMRNLESSYG